MVQFYGGRSGALLSSFGERIFIQIKRIGFENPYFIIFEGVNAEDGNRVHLIQHTSQISVLFVAVEVPKDEKRPAQRIGFHTDTP
jgi:hypothetical protein